MISKSLTRRLKNLESRTRAAAEPRVIQIRFVSPDGQVSDGPRITVGGRG